MPDGFSGNITVAAQLERNGVHYAVFSVAGRVWRLGSLAPDWREALRAFFAPGREAELAAREIWIQPEPRGSLAVMCCGLGSAWPGMGRELYSSFAAARQAMDQIAALADWDILALLESPELEQITPTRWQIPYLFMLEYAQWRQFQALGIKPDLICGHSLGELIALCLAGVYSLESAWYLLETRAEHMAELEARGHQESGMLAVPAGEEEIAAILAQWPDLRISNRNTERQFILGGLREHLLLARKQLRKKRIPAIMLNMDLAFHNPAMRILRNMSLRRLNGLKMSPPAFPVFSCVDARAYPDSQPAICERIADLDENTVDWVNLIAVIKAACPQVAFLELGPQETLCGITSELAPGSACIHADRRSHEAYAMRSALARLFAAGFLDFEKIAQSPAGEALACAPDPAPKPRRPAPQLEGDAALAIELLAEFCHRPVGSIDLALDLRQDLALRSSQFPWLMLEAERRLGRPVILENLFRLVTVADLVNFICGAQGQIKVQPQARAARQPWLAGRVPLARHVISRNGELAPAPFDPKPNAKARSCIFRRFSAGAGWRGQVEAWFGKIRNLPGERLRAIAWIDNGEAERNPDAIPDLFRLELDFGTAAEVVWAAADPLRPFPRFCLNSGIYAEVFPDLAPVAAADGSVLRLGRHFSSYKNPWPARHGVAAQFSPLLQQRDFFANAAWLPLSQILETMALGSAVAAPWLMPVAFADLHIFHLPALPEGITRECAISVSSRLSTFLDGMPARLCRTAIEVAPLTRSGRKLAGSLPVSDGVCAVTAEIAPFPPIWANGHRATGPASPVLESFYDLLGMREEWRLLRDVRHCQDNAAWLAAIELPARPGGQAYLLADACLQAAAFALALRSAANRTEAALAAALLPWRFAAIGFIRFNPEACARPGELALEWAISWEDQALTRFDAQIRDAAGGLALTIHNLEFDRIDRRHPDQADAGS